MSAVLPGPAGPSSAGGGCAVHSSPFRRRCARADRARLACTNLHWVQSQQLLLLPAWKLHGSTSTHPVRSETLNSEIGWSERPGERQLDFHLLGCSEFRMNGRVNSDVLLAWLKLAGFRFKNVSRICCGLNRTSLWSLAYGWSWAFGTLKLVKG